MNRNQIQLLRTTIEKSRARIMRKLPSLALLLMYVRFVAVPGMDRISTNGNCIFFDPPFLNKLKDDEVDFILCHQIMHVLCEDVLRPEGCAFSNYHYACDLRINSLLLEEGVFLDSYSHFGSIQYRLPGIRGDVSKLTIDEILANLVFNLDSFDAKIRRKYLVDSDVYWGKAPLLRGCTLILDRENSEYINILTEETIAAATKCEEWREHLAIAVSSTERHGGNDDARGDGAGDGAGGISKLLKRIIKKMSEPTISWRKILNDFIQEQICDYSFSPPDRRFLETGFFLPDFNEKDFESKEILFMVDTSGSVDDEELADVYSEIKGALLQFNGALVGKLGFFDSEASVPVPMSSVDDLISTYPIGGGGTDFRSIFSPLKYGLPACIIVFTDGIGAFPDEKLARGVPVLWVINNEKTTPPWGKTVRLIPKYKNERMRRV